MRTFLLYALLLVLCCSAEAKRKHYKSLNILLAPSKQSLLLQNQTINTMGLERIGDERRLSKLVEDGMLVSLPMTEAVKIAPSLPSNRRYVLPMVNSFLVKLSSEYYAEFHQPLMVDSAVRPETVQKWLRRHNASAASVHGELASSHEAGCTIDLSRRMTKAQTRWLELRLVYYTFARQAIIVEEERRCFHIMVEKEINNENRSINFEISDIHCHHSTRIYGDDFRIPVSEENSGEESEATSGSYHKGIRLTRRCVDSTR